MLNNSKSIAQNGSLEVKTFLERPFVPSNSVANMFAMVQLKAPEQIGQSSKNHVRFNFVVLVDISSSMKQNNKLAHVQATLEYLIGKLGTDNNNRFCLIAFNHETNMLTNGLTSLNCENLTNIKQQLHNLKPAGSTDIGGALFVALEIINSAKKFNQLSYCDSPDSMKTDVYSILLFTDGLANIGLKGTSLVDTLKSDWYQCSAKDVVINTFGYGEDHDSTLLQHIALSSGGGMYYFVPSIEYIPCTFGECLAGLLHSVATDIKLSVEAFDGCRLIQFCLPASKVEEVKPNKQYNIQMGTLSVCETRTMLFRVSLRKMDAELRPHKLAKIQISYRNTLTGNEDTVSLDLNVDRPASCPKVVCAAMVPPELSKSMNRFNAVSAIQESVSKCYNRDYTEAQKTVCNCVQQIESSSTAQEPYCLDLVRDLKICSGILSEEKSFLKGVHFAYAYSTMYMMERAAGVASFDSSLLTPFAKEEVIKSKKQVHGYGYTSWVQEEESKQACAEVKKYIHNYMEGTVLQEKIPAPSPKPQIQIEDVFNLKKSGSFGSTPSGASMLKKSIGGEIVGTNYVLTSS